MHSSLNRDDRNLQHQAWILFYGLVKKALVFGGLEKLQVEHNLKQTIWDGDCQNHCFGAKVRYCWKRGFKQKILSWLESNRITRKHTRPITYTNTRTRAREESISVYLLWIYFCSYQYVNMFTNSIQVVLRCHGKCEPIEPKILES